MTAVTATHNHPPMPLRASLAQAWKVLALGGFAAWVLIVGSFHEAWFDEAQAWLLARDTDSLWTLLADKVRYEGTPGLWHAIVWVAIRLGLPYDHFYLLPAGFAIAGAAVVLWRAPFAPWLRVALLGSYFFGYQFSVVARGYCLDLLLIPLAAAFFGQRARQPVRYALTVGLIANVNAHGFVAAATLGAELAWQLLFSGRRIALPQIAAMFVVGGLGLFAMWSAWQPADNGYLKPASHFNPLLAGSTFLNNAMVDRIAVWTPSLHSKAGILIDLFLGSMITMLLQFPVIALVRAGRKRLVSLGALGAPLIFSAFVYAGRWHAGVLFLLWIFVLWVNWDNVIDHAARRRVVLAFAFVCALQGVQTVWSGVFDITTPYTSASTAAKALTAWRMDHPNARVDGFSFKSFEVQPWLPGNPYANYHGGAARPSYVIWAKQEPWRSNTDLAAWRQELASQPDLIVASAKTLHDKDFPLLPAACRMGYGIVAEFPGRMIWRGVRIEDETLYFYQRGSTGGCPVTVPSRR